jgi:hypothetical protein
MSKQVIGIGVTANDGNGDSFRTAFTKANENFTEVYADGFTSYARLADEFKTSAALTTEVKTKDKEIAELEASATQSAKEIADLKEAATEKLETETLKA